MASAIPVTVRAAEDALVEHLLRREIVIFAGAGVSVGSEPPLPDSQTLLESLQDFLPDDFAPRPVDDLDPLDVAQWYADEHGHQHLEMRLTRAYDLVEQKPSSLQRALMALPVNVIFTIGYDQALEQALAEHGTDPEVIIDDLQMFQVNALTATSLIKLYGCVSMPDSLVLTRDDYDTYAEHHRAFLAFLQAQLATRVILFAGFSFADPRFGALHGVIRQTLLAHRRRAFALELAPMQPLLARQWKKHGIDFITLPDLDAMIAFVERLSERAGGARQAVEPSTMLHTLQAAEASPAIASAAYIVSTLETLRRQIRRLLREASRHPALGLEPRLRDVAGDAAGTPSGLSTLRTLFSLAESLEATGYGLDGHEWRRLGNGLYRQREWPLAIRAYTVAMQAAHGTDPWTEGNLARAYLHLGQYARAEGLLRRLVFVRSPDDQALDTPWLVQRPSDLTEFGQAVLRRAEQLRDEGRLEQALSVLKEVRPWLRKGMGAPWMMALVQVERQRGARRVELPATSNHPYLLHCFGANYRLAYELSVLTRHFREAERCRNQAIMLFVRAVQEAPLLAEPRGHLIAMYYENLLQRPEAEANLRLNIEQVEDLAATSESGRKMRDALRARYTRAWSQAGM